MVLVEEATGSTQVFAAAALHTLAHRSDANKRQIAAAGAIGPLIALARNGDADGKQCAEAALRCLAVIPSNKKTIAALGHTIITAIIPTKAPDPPPAPAAPEQRAAGILPSLEEAFSHVLSFR